MRGTRDINKTYNQLNKVGKFIASYPLLGVPSVPPLKIECERLMRKLVREMLPNFRVEAKSCNDDRPGIKFSVRLEDYFKINFKMWLHEDGFFVQVRNYSYPPSTYKFPLEEVRPEFKIYFYDENSLFEVAEKLRTFIKSVVAYLKLLGCVP